MILAARHVIKQRNLEETKKLITYTLENAIACADISQNALGQILCLFDLSGSALTYHKIWAEIAGHLSVLRAL